MLVLSLADGSEKGRLSLGQDPVAVAVDEAAAVAYVSDNVAGDVYAVGLDPVRVLWKTTVGGRPGPLLLLRGRLYVSLFDAAAVAALDPASGRELGRAAVGQGPGELADDGQVACADGTAWDLAGHSRPAGKGFGLADGPGGLWTADAAAGMLVRLTDGQRVSLPGHLHPFWLATAGDGSLLVTAEGDDEDRDPGAVLKLDQGLHLTRLLTSQDPDLVSESGGRIYVAAHGERAVKVLQGGSLATWQKGAAVVALAPAPRLGLLVVLVNARE